MVGQAAPGVQAEREILRVAIELGDRETGKILPIPKAAKVWADRKKAEKPTPPPGGNAPVSGKGAEPKTTEELDYGGIHGKSTDDLIQEAMDRGEL